MNYEYYVDLFVKNANNSVDIDYKNKSSVKKANFCVDRYRKAAYNIGKNYPDRISDFANLLNDNNEKIRVIAAICLIELMPHTKEHLLVAKEIIHKYMTRCDEVTYMGLKWWLQQSWADNSTCIDQL